MIIVLHSITIENNKITKIHNNETIQIVVKEMFTHDQQIGKLMSIIFPIIGHGEIGNYLETTGCGVLIGTKVCANITSSKNACSYLDDTLKVCG